MTTVSGITEAEGIETSVAEGARTEVDPAGGTARVVFPYRPMLDVVRFLAAIWVMLSHTDAVRGGGHAVSVFFVLSGYLIGGQLVCEKIASGTVRLPEFYFKRVTRIWIPYFVVLAGFIALFIARGQDAVPGFYERMFAALTYTYNLINAIRGNIHPTWVTCNQIWSLSIEEQFYLVVPLLIRWMPARTIVPVSLVLTLLFLWFFPLYAGLALGVLMAAGLMRSVPANVSLRVSVVAGALFLVACGLLFAVGQSTSTQTASVTYLLSGVIVLLANYVELPRRLHGGLRYLGLMTYSYYLIHDLPVYFLGALLRRILSVSGFPVWVHIGFGLLALPLSFLFVRWIELPALRIRGEMLKAKSPVIRYAPWLAWGLSLVGVIGLIYFSHAVPTGS
jgi:peptidoglycan/LPS O-acetylase OafA/YrhL